MRMLRRRRVLFISEGNSVRGQMAEAIVNHSLRERWVASSADTRPAGYVHPLALEALAEIGVEVCALRSKTLEDVKGKRFDLIVVLYSKMKGRPIWSGAGKLLHVLLPDLPEAADHSARLASFRSVRDAVVRKVFDVLAGAEADVAPLEARG